ncbi:MAG: ferrous iron transport protein B [Cytophagales bacterium]|nr:ferrous iron transport protein B [Armatimonadota bacterium]
MTPSAAAPSPRAPKPPRRPLLALVGNPNCGKTTLFNALTGLRQKVGNYPGVTVERKEGSVTTESGTVVGLIDLPGLYSLTPHSPDERIARDVLLGYRSDMPRPDAIVNVVDASNLERNLYLTSQLLDLGVPLLIALTMSDTASQHGIRVDAVALSRSLGVTVIPILASRRQGLREITEAFALLQHAPPPPPRRWVLPPVAEQEVEEMTALLIRHHDLPPATAFTEATLLLGLPEGRSFEEPLSRWSPSVREHLKQDLAHFARENVDLSTSIAEARYGDVGRVVSQAMRRTEVAPVTLSDKLDRVFMHRFWGYVIFLALMALIFQTMFTWAGIPQGWIETGINAVKDAAITSLPSGDLRDLFVEGVLGGVGNSLVFLPQILLLFLFISTLEDTGYLARAAFLMDRLMSRVGLHGKSFIPLLSSYACAIPGILATRTIDSPRARLLTILVAPLMSCSARLPVYALMIGAFIPPTLVLGFHLGSFAVGLTLPALTLFSMYALGTVMAFLMAALFNRTLLKGEPPTFLLEMPPYRLPSPRTVVYQMAERAWLFLKRAGTVILAISIVLWFLASYPRAQGANASEQVRQSYAGWIGRTIEPMIAPLGFDWKMGIGLVSSFAAREVFVTAMGTIYNVDDNLGEDEDKLSIAVGDRLKSDINPATGQPTFTPLVAVALMVFYVLAMQCMSTVAVVRRETNGWKWPLFQIGYMTILAWVVTFLVYQGGRLLGYR